MAADAGYPGRVEEGFGLLQVAECSAAVPAAVRRASSPAAPRAPATGTAGRMPALRKSHLQIWSLFQVNTFYETHLPRAQRQDYRRGPRAFAEEAYALH